MVIGETRSGQSNNGEGDGEQAQEHEQSAGGSAGGSTGGTGDVGAGETEGGELADTTVEKCVNRQQSQEDQQPRILKFKIALHLWLLALLFPVGAKIACVVRRVRSALLLRGPPRQDWRYLEERISGAHIQPGIPISVPQGPIQAARIPGRPSRIRWWSIRAEANQMRV